MLDRQIEVIVTVAKGATSSIVAEYGLNGLIHEADGDLVNGFTIPAGATFFGLRVRAPLEGKITFGHALDSTGPSPTA